MNATLFAVVRRAASAMALLMLLAATSPAMAQQQVVDLYPRSGVTLRYLALAPSGTPKAIVILFTGNQGIANIPDKPGPNWAQAGAFVVRSREMFRQHGL